MALVTEAAIAAFVNPVFEDALFIARDNNVMLGAVTQFNDRQGLGLRQNSQYGTATINTIGETDDLTSQTFTPASIATITPTEAGAQFFVTDSRVESDPFGVRTDAATELGMATTSKIEQDLIHQFTSFTGGSVLSPGTAPTWANIQGLLALLRAQRAPFPYACVMHPYHWTSLGSAAAVGATVTNAPNFQDAVMQKYYVGSMGPVDFFITSNVESSGGTVVGATGAGTAVIGMFSQQALAIDWRRPPRLEPERDASRRGLELNISTVYGVAAWRPLFGAYAYAAATKPT